MTKIIADAAYDAALNTIKNNAIKLFVLPLAVTTYASANSTNLATTSIASGDMIIADGDVSGRKLTVASVQGLTVTVTNSASHIALTDAATVLYSLNETSANVALTSGGTVDVGLWKWEITDGT